MALFLVVSEESQAALSSAISALGGGREWMPGHAYVVPFKGSAQELTLKLVDNPSVKRAGIFVARIEADYYGFSAMPNWDWLAAAFKQQANG